MFRGIWFLVITTLLSWSACSSAFGFFHSLLSDNSTKICLSEATSLEMNRWLYKNSVVNFILFVCLLAVYIALSYSLRDQDKWPNWIDCIPVILLSILFIITSLFSLIYGIPILAHCDLTSLSSLLSSVLFLNIITLYLLMILALIVPLLEK